MSTRTALLVAGLGLYMFTIIGCTPVRAPSPPTEEPEAAVPETVEAEVTIIADEPTPDEAGRITISMADDMQIPTPGSALITGNGTRLYRVDAVELAEDGSINIITSQGSLAQLGITGEFEFVDAPDAAKLAKVHPQQLGIDGNFQILDVSLPFSNTFNLTADGGVVATASGLFEMDGFFHLAFDVGFTGLRTFSSSIGGSTSLDLNVDLTAESTINGFSNEYPVTTPVKYYYVGAIGFVPVVVEVSAQLFIGFDGSVTGGASAETGVNAATELEVGAGYDRSLPAGRRWSAVASSGFNWGYDVPVVCAAGAGDVRAYLRPHFEVQLYSVAGPTFDVEPYLRLDGSVDGCLGETSASYDLTLTTGAAGYAKIKVDVLDRSFESPTLTVFDVSTQLASWGNAPDDSGGDGGNDDASPTPPVLFSLPLDQDTAGNHFYFDQDGTGGCKAWNGSTSCDDWEAAYNGHRGTDFAPPPGTPVYAAQAGILIKKVDGHDRCPKANPEDNCPTCSSNSDEAWGNYIVLDHEIPDAGERIRTFYLHLEKGTLTAKEEGAQVACGEHLGDVGNSGYTCGVNGYHLHFGAHHDAPPAQPGAAWGSLQGTPFDPYDGYPYWGQDAPGMPAPRASFWAATDAQGHPLKTCEAPPPPNPPAPAEIAERIKRYAEESNIPSIVIAATMADESGWRQFIDASGTVLRGPTGDIGIMQINPAGLSPEEVDRLEADWDYNLYTGCRNLADKFRLSARDTSSLCDGVEDTRADIVENWYYPMAWYVGSGPTAYSAIRRRWDYMRNLPVPASIYFTSISDLGDPLQLPSFPATVHERIPYPGGFDISTATPDRLLSEGMYTLSLLLSGGQRVHSWDSQRHVPRDVSSEIPERCSVEPVPPLIENNDDCANATPIFTDQPVVGSTLTATNDGAGSCGSSGSSPDVWYLWTSDADGGFATASLCGGGTTYDSVLEVLPNCGFPAIDCNDDRCGTRSEVSWSAAPNTDYWIRVSGYSSAAGPFSLLVTQCALIPSDWIRCSCPTTHYCYGIECNGDRYHAHDIYCATQLCP